MNEIAKTLVLSVLEDEKLGMVLSEDGVLISAVAGKIRAVVEFIKKHAQRGKNREQLLKCLKEAGIDTADAIKLLKGEKGKASRKTRHSIYQKSGDFIKEFIKEAESIRVNGDLSLEDALEKINKKHGFTGVNAVTTEVYKALKKKFDK